MGVYATSKLPKFDRNDFKHDSYCCTWWWFQMSAQTPFEHPVQCSPPRILRHTALIRTGFAPGRTKQPPVFKCFAAKAAEIVELHTDCFHIKSAFLIKSGEFADPPAQPPAMLMIASTLVSWRSVAMLLQTELSCSVQERLGSTRTFSLAASLGLMSTEQTHQLLPLKCWTITFPKPPRPNR